MRRGARAWMALEPHTTVRIEQDQLHRLYGYAGEQRKHAAAETGSLHYMKPTQR